MLESFLLAAHFIAPEPAWSERKRLLRERVAEVVATGNCLYQRNDQPPRIVKERLQSMHGKYDHVRDWIVLDLESLHAPQKFRHVVHETIPHEWAHKLNRAINGQRGHGAAFQEIHDTLRSKRCH